MLELSEQTRAIWSPQRHGLCSMHYHSVTSLGQPCRSDGKVFDTKSENVDKRTTMYMKKESN